jgi:hypothetical protein
MRRELMAVRRVLLFREVTEYGRGSDDSDRPVNNPTAFRLSVAFLQQSSLPRTKRAAPGEARHNGAHFEEIPMPRLKMLVSALLLAGAPHAEAATEEALAGCRAIRDSVARLACYDGLPLAPTPPARVAPPAAGTGRAAPPVAAAPPVVAAPQNDSARFGLPATSAPAPVESIETRIEGHFAGWYPGSRIRLENGQVWQVTDGTSRFADVTRPKVTVKRGALGSFFLDIEGVNPAPRVRRVE